MSSLHTCRKEHRFLLDPSQTLVRVVAEIRRQTGLKDDTKFNLKWLDVEGRSIPYILSSSMLYISSPFEYVQG